MDANGRSSHLCKIYRRMGFALHRGHGMRLSPDDIRELVYGDDAVGTALANICGHPEQPEDVEHKGPLSPDEASRIAREHYGE